MKQLTPPLVMLVLVAFVACQSLYTGTVTLTKVVEGAAREYARVYNDGLVPPELAAKAAIAHAEYRKAAGVAADALEAVKLGKTADVKGTLEAARVAASHFIELLVTLLPPHDMIALRTQVQKASAP